LLKKVLITMTLMWVLGRECCERNSFWGKTEHEKSLRKVFF
jgi:hypothetical protein